MHNPLYSQLQADFESDLCTLPVTSKNIAVLFRTASSLAQLADNSQVLLSLRAWVIDSLSDRTSDAETRSHALESLKKIEALLEKASDTTLVKETFIRPDLI